MKTLKITATLLEPLAGADPPMLDSLMEWCMSRHVGRDLGLTHDDVDRVDYSPGLIPTPIARQKVDSYPYPIPLCTSPILSVPQSDSVEHFAKRLDLSEPLIFAESERKVINNTGGEFKGYRLPLRMRTPQKIVWFAVGDRKEIRRLLKDVDALGKKTSIGNGRVASWNVEHWDAPEQWCWFAESKQGPVLMRPMPSGGLPENLIGSRPWFGGVAPPYWSQKHFVKSVIPC